jgi:predicted ATPase
LIHAFRQRLAARGWRPAPSSQAPSLKPLVPSGEAEGYFLKAIEIARQQEAKWWELRATTSLARLWQRQGKANQAHSMLSELYNWFTEGFDTKDLQEAKALLEALAD